MKELWTWLVNHGEAAIAFVTALLTGGGTGAYGAKKMIDKHQTEKIKANQIAIGDLEKRMTIMESELKANKEADARLRQDMNEMVKDIKSNIDKIMTWIMNKA